ncbi:ribonuclease BN [Rhodococcus sp. SC4]|uniref:YihY/virulence factor BrkB family protein n=1 Tax=unclassified Rhodococcus (in: high G+C Gram-positive bacteria) TaxID=192944 RepID=UPI000769B4EB|nr:MULTISPECIES: YihY/virulence factor BrkB family protein [unclassified Rhodococcus (in: high G+C Gram-positive bacteria)]KXF53241.1 ribonuclease BN [Rhodococcus sp. SC4]KXX54861.1 ribonuclease BN [Rhodococcus sp. LB1]
MTETPSTTPQSGGDPPRSGWHPLRRALSVIGHTASKAWDDSIFGKAATAAFWQTLSLPPLLLGLLGMLGYVGGWFGPDTVDIIQSKIINFSGTVFSDSVVEQIIRPTVGDVLERGRPEIVSLSFLLSLWAGSSAISTFVDSIVEAHGQQEARHPVWQRVFALLLYVMFLILAVFTLPLVALGPTLVGRVLPEAWRTIGTEIVDTFYYPGVGLLLIVGLTTLYKVALPRSLPWHRLLGGALVAGVFFLGASTCLRRYLSWVAGTGYTYGALATPIAFLLFTFFLGFAVVLGAEFNATVQEFWPARATRIDQMRDWIAAQAESSPSTGPVTSLTRRIATGPIKVVGDRARPDAAEPDPGNDDEPDGPVREAPEPPGVRRAPVKPQSPLRNPS